MDLSTGFPLEKTKCDVSEFVSDKKEKELLMKF